MQKNGQELAILTALTLSSTTAATWSWRARDKRNDSQKTDDKKKRMRVDEMKGKNGNEKERRISSSEGAAREYT